MAEPNEAAVLDRAKALAKKEGFAWEPDFGPAEFRAPIRGQHFLSADRQREYLERARAELRQETSSA